MCRTKSLQAQKFMPASQKATKSQNLQRPEAKLPEWVLGCIISGQAKSWLLPIYEQSQMLLFAWLRLPPGFELTNCQLWLITFKNFQKNNIAGNLFVTFLTAFDSAWWPWTSAINCKLEKFKKQKLTIK